jgi:hypothetical protein
MTDPVELLRNFTSTATVRGLKNARGGRKGEPAARNSTDGRKIILLFKRGFLSFLLVILLPS